MTMPPLPEPVGQLWAVQSPIDVWSESAMRAYAEAAVAAEREACAKVCEQIATQHLSSGRYVSVIADHYVRAGGQVDGAEECADAIRSRT